MISLNQISSHTRISKAATKIRKLSVSKINCVCKVKRQIKSAFEELWFIFSILLLFSFYLRFFSILHISHITEYICWLVECSITCLYETNLFHQYYKSLTYVQKKCIICVLNGKHPNIRQNKRIECHCLLIRIPSPEYWSRSWYFLRKIKWDRQYALCNFESFDFIFTFFREGITVQLERLKRTTIIIDWKTYPISGSRFKLRDQII